MKRRSFLRGAAAGVAAATAAAPAIAQSQPAIHWRMASSFPKSLDTLFGAAETHHPPRGRDHRGPVPDPRSSPADEIVPGLQVLDAVQNGTVECGHTAAYYYVGKDPGFRVRDRAAVRAQRAAAERLDVPRRRRCRRWPDLFKEYSACRFPAGNTGAQMGGWFRKEIKSVARSEGPQDAHRRPGRPGAREARRGAAADRGRRDLPGARARDDGRRRMGRPVRRREARLSTRWRSYYYYPGWWEGGPQLSVLVNTEKWATLPKRYQGGARARRARNRTCTCSRATTRRTPTRCAGWWRAGAQLRAFPRPVLEAAQKAAFELYDELAAEEHPLPAHLRSWLKFRAGQFLWFRVAEMSYDNFVFTSPARPAARKK